MVQRFLLTFALASGMWAANETAPLLETENAFGKALTANDFNTLDKLLADDLVYTHSGANTDTKSSYLESLRSGNQKYTSFDYRSSQAKLYGDTGLVFAEVDVKSVTKGAPSSSRLRIIHVYVKNQGHWQLVAHQSTKVPQP